MESNQSRYFTLMIMPDSSTVEVRRVRVSRRLVVGGLVCGSFLFLMCAAGLVHGLYMWEQARENVSLRLENDALRGRIVSLDQRMEDVDAVVERVKQFDSKLRTISMVSDPERHLAIGPVGSVEGLETGIGNNPSLRADLLGAPTRSVALAEKRVADAQAVLGSVEKSVTDLAAYLKDQEARLSSVPSRAPARGYVSSVFGMRIDPFTGLPQMHAGLDYSANVGARVTSTADGLVISAGTDGTYGKLIKVDHGNGIVSQYAHLSEVHVKVGDRIKRGQLIGAVGNTGRSTGPHLHYEIRLNGVPTDPQRFLLD